MWCPLLEHFKTLSSPGALEGVENVYEWVQGRQWRFTGCPSPQLWLLSSNRLFSFPPSHQSRVRGNCGKKIQHYHWVPECWCSHRTWDPQHQGTQQHDWVFQLQSLLYLCSDEREERRESRLGLGVILSSSAGLSAVTQPATEWHLPVEVGGGRAEHYGILEDLWCPFHITRNASQWYII